MFIFIHLELVSKVFLEKDTTIGRTETGEPEILQIDRVKRLDCVGRLTWNSRLIFICTIQCNQLTRRHYTNTYFHVVSKQKVLRDTNL